MSVSKCATSRCATCKIIQEGQSFEFNNGKIFTVKQNMNCKSKNIIYLICKKCGDFYIGQTSCELRKRMTVHRQHTKTDELRFLYVNQHFHNCSGNEFLVFPLYKVFPENSKLLDQKERCMITLLKPKLNSR